MTLTAGGLPGRPVAKCTMYITSSSGLMSALFAWMDAEDADEAAAAAATAAAAVLLEPAVADAVVAVLGRREQAVIG